MNILIVEDNLDRIEYFKKRMQPNNLLICTTAENAISLLNMKIEFDEIWLDHDLDGMNYQGDEQCKTSNLCGCAVSRLIKSLDIKCKVIIHSQNYYGSNSIKQILPNAIQIPFSSNI